LESLTEREKVTEGERLSEAMAAYPDSFPGVYRAMVAARRSMSGCRAESPSCLKGQMLPGDGSPKTGA